jgi:hypothetical protein
MEIAASFDYKGALAHFKIRKENSGIYYADLIRYEGAPCNAPPEKIIIIRGIRQWTGSYNDDYLLSRLGEIIEQNILNFAETTPRGRS